MTDIENNATQTTGMEQDYLDTIQKMKETTVSREAYDKQLEENRKLLNALVSGENINAMTQEEAKKPTAQELRNKLFNEQHTNVEYAKLALELRNAVIEEGGEDPFVPQGRKISATREDYELAEKVAQGLNHCIEYADGDSEVFTNELQRITKDTVIPSAKRKR